MLCWAACGSRKFGSRLVLAPSIAMAVLERVSTSIHIEKPPRSPALTADYIDFSVVMPFSDKVYDILSCAGSANGMVLVVYLRLARRARRANFWGCGNPQPRFPAPCLQAVGTGKHSVVHCQGRQRGVPPERISGSQLNSAFILGELLDEL